MRKMLVFGVAAILLLSLSGCGDGDGRTVFVARILSDQPADGDIAFDGVNYTIINGPDTLFFGIDEANPNLPEYRAFLDFPLDGSTQQDAVPLNARIRAATVEVFISEVSFASAVPALIDLVIFPINGLRPEDYDSDPLRFPDGTFASRSLEFFPIDVGNPVRVDVTALMAETQRRGLPDFQIRLLLDFVVEANGLVGIVDLPQVAVTAPLLTVEYD